MCQKFDPEKLKLEGDPVSISSGVWSSQNIYGLSGFSASETGVLAFRGGGSERSQLTWYDRTGKKLGAASPPASEAEPHFSPDEKHLIANRGSDLWIMDLSSGKWSRFTFDPSDDGTAAYSPDGSLVFFGSNRKGKHDIYVKPTSGVSQEKLLLQSPHEKYPDDVSRDGKFILFEDVDPKTKFDLWILPVAGDQKPFPFLKTPDNEAHAQFSPNGRWVAYVSDESGRAEVYVRSFPAEKGGKWQVSSDGGDQPWWRSDAKELFYMDPSRRLISVKTSDDSAEFQAEPPVVLFPTNMIMGGMTSNRNNYLPNSAGDKFLVNDIVTETTSVPITVIVNWTSALKR
jgi:Tol biopolymer transport system component